MISLAGMPYLLPCTVLVELCVCVWKCECLRCNTVDVEWMSDETGGVSPQV